MRNFFSRPRTRRNARKSNNARRGFRKIGVVENLETRKLLTVTGFAGDLAAAAPMPMDHATPVEVSSSNVDTDVVRVQRIVNGEATSGFSAVGIVNGQCTGTLIAPNAVLTAAHCVEPGSGNGQSFEVEGRTYGVDTVHVHSGYDTDDSDLAIMILSEPVQGVEPIDIFRGTPQVGQVLTLVGYGATGTPQAGHNGSFGTKNVGETPIDSVEENWIRWNFDNASEANTAPGDSGGPAFVTVDNELFVAGVTSGGTLESAGLGDNSFDTRVDTFASWIDGIVSGNPQTGGGDNGDSNDSGSDSGSGDASDGLGNEVGDGAGVADDLGDDAGGDDGLADELEDGFGGFTDSDAVELAQEELANYDADGDGALSFEELTDEFGGDDVAAEDAEYLIADFDANGDGRLDLSELTESWGGEPIEDGSEADPAENDLGGGGDAGMGDDLGDEFGGEDSFDDFASSSPAELAEEELANYDADGDGALSFEELTDEFGGDDVAAEDAEYLIADFDANGDGQLDFSELTESWGGTAVGSEGEPGDETGDGGGYDGDDLIGDVNGDGHCDSDDLGMLLNDFGGAADSSPTDLNLDAWVDSDDLGMLLNDFGAHDYEFEAEDINRDGHTTPLDALLVINRLNGQRDAEEGLDVNGDGEVSPIDALQVVNRINAGQAGSVDASRDSDDDDNEVVDRVFATTTMF